eukprot:1392020-Amorphochlora_amoeboformis.AAC.1
MTSSPGKVEGDFFRSKKHNPSLSNKYNYQPLVLSSAGTCYPTNTYAESQEYLAFDRCAME